MATGFLDNNRDPCISISVEGPVTQPIELTCLIDTGFSGFLSIPLTQAFPIGLILYGTTTVTLANAQQEHRLMCLGHCTVDKVSKLGIILIETQGQQALLGMDFLRQFGKRLLVDPVAETVELLDAATPAAPPAASE